MALLLHHTFVLQSWLSNQLQLPPWDRLHSIWSTSCVYWLEVWSVSIEHFHWFFWKALGLPQVKENFALLRGIQGKDQTFKKSWSISQRVMRWGSWYQPSFWSGSFDFPRWKVCTWISSKYSFMPIDSLLDLMLAVYFVARHSALAWSSISDVCAIRWSTSPHLRKAF